MVAGHCYLGPRKKKSPAGLGEAAENHYLRIHCRWPGTFFQFQEKMMMGRPRDMPVRGYLSCKGSKLVNLTQPFSSLSMGRHIGTDSSGAHLPLL